MRRIRATITAIATAYLITVVIVIVMAVVLPLQEPDRVPRADMIVVLGGGMFPDGRLRPSSSVRVDRSVALFNSGAAPRIHFTGGVGRGVSAGEQMAGRAFAAGVPRSAISMETRSQSTLQNALFSRPRTHTADHILLVSEGFHLARSWVSFKVFGAKRVTLISAGSPHDRPVATLRAILREALAIWFNLARFAIWHGAVALGLDTRGEATLLR